MNQNAATNHRFVHIMQIGDLGALSNAKDQWIYLGTVESPYYFASPPTESKDFRHQRQVKWQIAYPRGAFSEAFRASLKSELTLFSLDAHADELRAKLGEEHND